MATPTQEQVIQMISIMRDQGLREGDTETKIEMTPGAFGLILFWADATLSVIHPDGSIIGFDDIPSPVW